MENVGAAFDELQQMASAVAKVEDMVRERLEPLSMHVVGMKRRMLSAQEEATRLRGELSSAQQRCKQLQVRAPMPRLLHPGRMPDRLHAWRHIAPRDRPVVT